jgi:hypothetical protein
MARNSAGVTPSVSRRAKSASGSGLRDHKPGWKQPVRILINQEFEPHLPFCVDGLFKPFEPFEKVAELVNQHILHLRISGSARVVKM